SGRDTFRSSVPRLMVAPNSGGGGGQISARSPRIDPIADARAPAVMIAPTISFMTVLSDENHSVKEARHPGWRSFSRRRMLIDCLRSGVAYRETAEARHRPQ